MVFERIRRVHGTLKFIHSRTPDYIRLARQDVIVFRHELVQTLFGLGVGAASGMFFMCFLSVAIIVTVWDSRYRVLTTWMVCGGWGVLAGAGLLYSRRALSGPAPFANLAAALLHDLQVIEADSA
jgi:Putative Actinobacterial Holin-X, holin superfamily III